ncbi:MAG: hypothetical protein M3542_05630 [Acidobacteriota bacterium]|nr:hypothetical protein [Acidobacteriota bacterium]MDQ5871461.1 hypothetical protein [Acidobacteriota bacterium]
MNTPLRILLVESSTADAESFAEELRRAGHEVFWEIVRVAAEMEQAVFRLADRAIRRTLTGLHVLTVAVRASPDEDRSPGDRRASESRSGS